MQGQALGSATSHSTGGPRSCDCILSEEKAQFTATEQVFIKRKRKKDSIPSHLTMRTAFSKRKYGSTLTCVLFHATIFGCRLSRRGKGVRL